MTVTVTFAGCGDAFGSGGRFQACIHLQQASLTAPVLLDCGATSLTALRRCGLDPGEIGVVFLSHLHGDHFGGLPFLILDGQFSRRSAPLVIAGPAGTEQRLTAAMECLFPGSSQVRRKFEVGVVELIPGRTASVAGIPVGAFPATAIGVLLNRLSTGHWNVPDLATLNDEAASLGSSDNPLPPAFTSYAPAPYLRPFNLPGEGGFLFG
jgi:ribonuclease BN (tRNA processing enzyme)